MKVLICKLIKDAKIDINWGKLKSTNLSSDYLLKHS